MMGDVPGPLNKVKKRARIKLWDSLLEVYEKTSGGDCQEVDVSDVDQWCQTEQNTELPKALPVLLETKPHIVCHALPGLLRKPLDELTEIENDQRKKRNKPAKPKLAASIKKNAANLQTEVKPSLDKKPLGKCNTKRKRNQEEPVVGFKSTEHSINSIILNKPKKFKILKSNSENVKYAANLQTEVKPSLDKKQLGKCNTKRKRNQEEPVVGFKSTEHSINSIILNKPKKFKILKSNSENVNYFNHKCNLQLRYPSEVKNTVVRPDGRIFSCELIFRVCKCLDSDETF